MFNASISTYGIMIILALIANVVVVVSIFNRYKISKKEIFCLLLYENAGIIIGAKVLTYLQNYEEFEGKFNFFELGLSSYGAVIGALLFVFLFCWQFKKSSKEILGMFIMPFPLMYAIGKIGCFIAGCCFGIEYHGIGKVIYNHSIVAPANVYLFPIQLVEVFCFIIIFIYLISKVYKNKGKPNMIGLTFCLCGVTKFLLDFLRDSHNNQILSLNQIISIIFFVIGLVIINFENNKISKKL